jgi:hypothetical protein
MGYIRSSDDLWVCIFVNTRAGRNQGSNTAERGGIREIDLKQGAKDVSYLAASGGEAAAAAEMGRGR